MDGYDEETENKNFISGEKYCHDLPSTCDCGVERTAPPNRTEKGRLHYEDYGVRVNVSQSGALSLERHYRDCGALIG